MQTQTKRYNFTPIVDRPVVSFPNKERIAVVIYINLEHFPEDRPGPAIVPHTAHFMPDALNYGWRDYGQRVGIWRLMETLDKHGLPASVCLNSDVCREYPRVVEEGSKRRWDFMGHGRNNSEIVNGLSFDEEAALIEETIAVIAAATAEKPKGWLSPFLTETHATPDLLAERGIEYLCDYACDDLPFKMNVKKGSLLGMPYSVECNDLPSVLTFGASGEDFGRTIRDQFDVLYEEGERIPRVLPIALHPFITGQAFRTKHLAAAFAYISSHKDVWVTTSGEINKWYRQHHLRS
ncbi:polysaccharide deacetylase family protein [Bradyrhizobium liaoningense]|uniref:polysaccharide deacetylase family protein n=1 Tax=Bradyrhizobium liaoningense TaxID=43992 RepID=UPI001BA70E47|nr:polysaccharide deacetylase family protein [Bradyrhizobium liaoningense]MBR0902686.1 polysaccharide deacetylase family protein [Bradyrhizobium liaoningense]